MSVSVEPAPVAVPGQERAGRGRSSRLIPDRWGLLVLPGALFLLICFAYPAVVLLATTFTDFVAPEVGGTDNLSWFFGEPANLAVLRRTVVVAFLVTALSAVTGFPYAYLMTLVGPRLRLLLLGVLVASFLGSLLVRSFSWLILLQRNGPLNGLLDALGLPRLDISGSQTAVVISMTQILVPLVILSVYATLQGSTGVS